MRLLETGNDKVKKICDVLRKETLDPAKKEANMILDSAKAEADKIMKHAQEKAAHMIHDAEERLKKQEEVFKASLNLAFKQAIAKLKSDIQQKLFNKSLHQKISSDLNNSTLLAECLKSIFEALKQSGLETDAQIVLSSKFTQEQIAQAITHAGLDSLKNHIHADVEVSAGVKIRLENNHLTIDLSDETLEQIILTFASDTLKKLVFNQ